MIRIGCAGFGFGDLSLEESAEVVKSLGFSLVDVGSGPSNYSQIVQQKAVADPVGQADRLRRVMDKHGLEISELFILHFGKPINHPDPATREWTRDMFDGITTFAQKAGFESVMMIPGHVHHDQGQQAEEAFDISVQQLRFMVSKAKEKGLQCNIEPCLGSLADKPAEAIRLVGAVPGLGLTLDYAHQIQLGLSQEEIEPLHKFAKHCHAKQSAPGSFQARVEEGVIDFKRLIRKLKADDYQGVVCVEFVTSQELLDQGWDFKKETLRLKAILEKALEEN
jgi:sugar phosphate isomerase/epimerase